MLTRTFYVYFNNWRPSQDLINYLSQDVRCKDSLYLKFVLSPTNQLCVQQLINAIKAPNITFRPLWGWWGIPRRMMDSPHKALIIWTVCSWREAFMRNTADSTKRDSRYKSTFFYSLVIVAPRYFHVFWIMNPKRSSAIIVNFQIATHLCGPNEVNGHNNYTQSCLIMCPCHEVFTRNKAIFFLDR